MSIETDLRHASKQALEQLTALRDEARVQLHLLSLDARKRWDQLETEVDELETRANREGEKATDAIKQTAHKLTQFMAGQLGSTVGPQTNVRSLMATGIRSCRPDDSLNHVAQLMWNTDCGAIPVLSDATVVGIVTDRDLCMAAYTQGKPPADIRVETAMSKELFSCAADDSIATALATMGEKRVRRLPVLDTSGKLVGLLTIADVARWARSIGNAEVATALVDALGAISARSPQKFQSAAE